MQSVYITQSQCPNGACVQLLLSPFLRQVTAYTKTMTAHYSNIQY